MSASGLTFRAVKFAVLLLGLVLLDYTVFEGQMINEATIGFNHLLLDAPGVIPDMLKSFLDLDTGP